MLKPRSPDDFDRKLPPDTILKIGQLTLSWSRLDSILTQWLANETKADLELTYILVGRIEVRSKLDKLLSIFDYSGQTAKRAFVLDLQERIGKFYETRNLITHGLCLGTYKTDSRYLGYMSLTKVVRSPQGTQVPIGKVPINDLVTIAKLVDGIVTEIAAHIPPSEEVPPSLLLPLPQPAPPKKTRNRRERPRGSSQA